MAPPFPAFHALFTAAAGGELPGWDEAERAMAAVRVDAGGTVFAQGVEHPYVYAVRSGLLKLCYLGEDGTEWIKSFAHEGRFFASIAALQPGGRTSFGVVALEPCALERIAGGAQPHRHARAAGRWRRIKILLNQQLINNPQHNGFFNLRKQPDGNSGLSTRSHRVLIFTA